MCWEQSSSPRNSNIWLVCRKTKESTLDWKISSVERSGECWHRRGHNSTDEMLVNMKSITEVHMIKVSAKWQDIRSTCLDIVTFLNVPSEPLYLLKQEDLWCYNIKRTQTTRKCISQPTYEFICNIIYCRYLKFASWCVYSWICHTCLDTLINIRVKNM